MHRINPKKLKSYRVDTYNLPPNRGLASLRQAEKFVNKRGFIYFWPIKGMELPSLWTAVAGKRPVAEKHDDPGHVTWSWKDYALDKKLWYYAKILRRKATMISLENAPFFYALSENYGAPEEDYLLAYREGRLSQAAKQVYEALLDKGALNTLDLRKESKLTNARDSEFNKALEQLQADFKILPVGIAEAGAWRYSHIYQIVPRHYPELPERARGIKETQARMRLVELYISSVGATQPRSIARLFGWGNDLVNRTVNQLVLDGIALRAEHPGEPGDWLAKTEVI